jgi:regulator of protease activity HflC (stomatin/prohibitin superfamily)
MARRFSAQHFIISITKATVMKPPFFTILQADFCLDVIRLAKGRRAMSSFSIFVFVLLGLVIITVLASARIVPQGFNFTIERLGRYVRTAKPGLNILTPFIETVGRKLNMMERVLNIPTQEVITKDNAMVTVDAVAFFQVMDAAQAAYEVSDLSQAMMNLTMTNIRTVMGSLDLDELLSNRNEINARLLHIVDAATSPWGVKVTRIEIKDIAPPRDLVNAMARQMKAEREKRAVILEAEGSKQSAILKADGEKQAWILAAEGRKEAANRDAEARERLAEAEARATQMVSEAISNGNVQAINYFVANNYVKALEALAAAPNQKVLMMPLEASSLIGAIGGISEITREVFGSLKDEKKAVQKGAVPPVPPQGGARQS